MKALLVYPTHENLREVLQPYVEVGIHARAYQPRLTEDTEHCPQNCWNQTADEAEAMGFVVVKTVCPQCSERSTCKLYGYLSDLAETKAADVVLCTHKRVEYSDFCELVSNRRFVSVHENPINLLRPQAEASEADLIQVQLVLNRLMTDPRYLDWFGDALAVDDEGESYLDEERGLRRERLYDFTRHLCLMVDDLIRLMQLAESTAEWRPNETMRCPSGIQRLLFKATKALKVSILGQPWRFVLAAAGGELMSSAIMVSQQRLKGGEIEVIKSAIGFRNNSPSRLSTIWFNDATLGADTLRNILGSEVWDKTPGGRLELQKKAVQILRDITRATSKAIFANVIRGVLIDRPQFTRVGVICHRTHIAALQSLDPAFASRIAKSAYFGSGEERSSNAWHHECNLILIAGTPRLPPRTIASYLVQVGHVGAACQEPTWGTVRWQGQTESGEPITVSARGYHDEAWRRAHQDLVRAAIVQAIGRGRGILETGCEVIVLSTEECGLTISDSEMKTLNGSATHLLAKLTDLSLQNSNKYILGKCSVKSSELAVATGLSIALVRKYLVSLEQRGLVIREGDRGGWRPTGTPIGSAAGVEDERSSTRGGSFNAPDPSARDGPSPDALRPP